MVEVAACIVKAISRMNLKDLAQLHEQRTSTALTTTVQAHVRHWNRGAIDHVPDDRRSLSEVCKTPGHEEQHCSVGWCECRCHDWKEAMAGCGWGMD